MMSIQGSIVLRTVRETVKILESQKEKFAQVLWHDGESNLESGYSQLACSAFVEAWSQLKTGYDGFENSSVNARSPDISCEITDNDGKVHKIKVELKSSKKRQLPGSTIGKLDMNQMIIYCLHDNDNLEFRYGQYYQAIQKGQYDLFQDRTPRPLVKIDGLCKSDESIEYKEISSDFNTDHYAHCALRRIKSTKCSSWQDNLTRKIILEFVNQTSESDLMFIKKNGSFPIP